MSGDDDALSLALVASALEARIAASLGDWERALRALGRLQGQLPGVRAAVVAAAGPRAPRWALCSDCGWEGLPSCPAVPECWAPLRTADLPGDDVEAGP